MAGRTGKYYIRLIAKDIERLTEQVVIKLVVELTAGLRAATPVLTGWARANWVPSVGTRYDSDVAGDVTNDEAVQLGLISRVESEQQDGLVDVAGYRLARGKAFVVNNVFYIQRLNSGSSPKAPELFVEGEVERAIAAVRTLPGVL